MDENINLTILNEIGKATRMGLSSITFVSDKTEDVFFFYLNISKKLFFLLKKQNI